MAEIGTSAAAPCVEAYPEPSARVAALFQELFSDDQIAPWLLSREAQPPTLSLGMVQSSMTSNGVAPNSFDEAVDLIRTVPRVIENGIDVERQRVVGFSEPQKLVYVCHAYSQTRCFLTMTDERSMFSFLQPPGKAVPGVRRVVVIFNGSDLIYASNYWMKDGRSNMHVFRYSLYPKPSSEKYILLLAPYPNFRYPCVSDILETAALWEQPTCQYCTFRRLSKCECSPSAIKRSSLALAVRDDYNPWMLWQYLWGVYEANFKRYYTICYNHQRNISVGMSGMYFLRPTFYGVNRHEHESGYQYYLKSVAPYLTDRVVTWAGIVEPNMRSQPNSGSKRQLEHQRAAPSYPRNTGIPFMTNETVGAGYLEPGDPKCLSAEPQEFHFPVVHPAVGHAAQASHGFDALHQYNPSVRSNPKQALGEQHQTAPTPGRSERDNELTAVEATEPFLQYYSTIDEMPWDDIKGGICKLCRTTFVRKHDLKRHIKSRHLRQFDFACDECGAQFDRKANLDIHIQQAHQCGGRFGCSLCGKSFATVSSRRRHSRNVHNIENP